MSLQLVALPIAADSSAYCFINPEAVAALWPDGDAMCTIYLFGGLQATVYTSLEVVRRRLNGEELQP